MIYKNILLRLRRISDPTSGSDRLVSLVMQRTINNFSYSIAIDKSRYDRPWHSLMYCVNEYFRESVRNLTRLNSKGMGRGAKNA